MDEPLVSIIIPTYNRAHLIGETLDSVINQSYHNWECIIVDDGSTDHTQNIVNDFVKKDKRFKLFNRPLKNPPGGNAARNYGFEVSNGEYVNWFDDDDIMLENFIEDKLNAFTSELNFVIASGYYVDSELGMRNKIELFSANYLFKDYVLWNLKILTPSILFRKNFLLDKPLYNLSLFRGQEAELFSRLFFKIPFNEYLILNVPLFLYRQHENTKTAQNNSYVIPFKNSVTFIAIENFKRSIELDDKELINYYYKNILIFFFSALENNHTENVAYILNNFVPLLKKRNYRIAITFKYFGLLLSVLNFTNGHIRKFFTSIEID